MSRAMLVLDTEFQRRRAQDWVWAAKNGSRVEFKGPKRTLDQNSLMWALLTDIAVHMRKTAGLEYSTEEWKHIFLHGWGREVRFLPALDGKGVVPIPQSSSDLSKEEMTDFIEYILKEGAERGVTFHTPHEPSASIPADEAAAGNSPAQALPGPAAAPLSAPPAEPEGGVAASETAVETAHGEPPALPSEPMRRECITKLLALVTDAALSKEDRAQNLAEAADDWVVALGDKAFVTTVFQTCKRVLKGENEPAAARKYLEALP